MNPLNDYSKQLIKHLILVVLGLLSAMILTLIILVR